jgi:hypothetical protein
MSSSVKKQQQKPEETLREKQNKLRNDERGDKLARIFLQNRERNFFEPNESPDIAANIVSAQMYGMHPGNINPVQSPYEIERNLALQRAISNEYPPQYMISLNNNVTMAPMHFDRWGNPIGNLTEDELREQNRKINRDNLLFSNGTDRFERQTFSKEKPVYMNPNIDNRNFLNEGPRNPPPAYHQASPAYYNDEHHAAIERKQAYRDQNFYTDAKFFPREGLTSPNQKYRGRNDINGMLLEEDFRNKTAYEAWNQDEINNYPRGQGLNLMGSGKKPTSSQKRVKNYVFDERDVLGEGSFSKVYKGFCEISNVTVAVKEIDMRKCNKNSIDEIYITKSVSSPNVVQIYDYHLDYSNNKCYLILEYCNQGSLESQEYQRLSLTAALKYFQQIVNGMKALFNLNIIHRDLKRGNILIKDNMVKISDFGFAKNMGKYMEIDSIRCGTPSTMAPEIFFIKDGESNAKYNNKCDIWSLGVILHELVYWKHPFDLNPDQYNLRRRSHVTNKIPIVEDFINKALVFNPRDRMSWEDVFNHGISFANHSNQLDRVVSRHSSSSMGLSSFFRVLSIKDDFIEDLQQLTPKKRLLLFFTVLLIIMAGKRLIGAIN